MRLALSTNWNSREHAEGDTLVDAALEAGVDAIELGYALTHRQAADIDAARIAGRIQVSSVHAFCPVPMGMVSGHPEIFTICDRRSRARARAVEAVLETARFAVSMEARVIVLHAGRVPIHRAVRKLTALAEAGRQAEPRYARQLTRMQDARDRRAAKPFEALRASLAELVPALESLGVTLALENLPSWDAMPTESEMVRLLDEFPSPSLGYWHDIGHGQVRENLGLIHHEAVAHRLAGRLAGLHVHDVQPPTHDHLMPPRGKVRFEKFRDLARQDVPSVIEPAPGTPPEAVREAVDFLRAVWA